MKMYIKFLDVFKEPKEFEKKIDDAIYRSGVSISRNLVKEFKRLSPVRTGKLKKSLRFKAYRKTNSFYYFQLWYAYYAFSKKNIWQQSIINQKIKEAMPSLLSEIVKIELLRKSKK